MPESSKLIDPGDPIEPQDARLVRGRRLPHLALIGLTLVISLLAYFGIAQEMAATTKWIASDFIVLWTAADAPAPYDFEAITAAQQWYATSPFSRPFAYPPSFLPWLEPFRLLPMLPAYALWTGGTALLFLIVWARLVPFKAALLGMAAPTVILAAIPGQVVFLIGALVAGGVGLMSRRPMLAGALLGVAATIKPQAVILVPLALAASRNWRALASAILAGAVVATACIAVQGVDLWMSWLASLPKFMVVLRESGVLHAGITPTSALAAFGIDGALALAVKASASAFGLATIWILFRATDNVALRLVGLNVATLMVVPYAMPYELALSAPAAAMFLLDRRYHPGLALASFLIVTTAGQALLLPLCCAILIWVVRSGQATPGHKDEGPVPSRG